MIVGPITNMCRPVIDTMMRCKSQSQPVPILNNSEFDYEATTYKSYVQR